VKHPTCTRIGGWTRRLFLANHFSDEAALLDCNRSHSREHLAALIFQGGKVADDEYFRVAGNAEIRLHEYSPGSIDWHT
jgi:hypothetical protein